jgi:hypothetical protein
VTFKSLPHRLSRAALAVFPSPGIDHRPHSFPRYLSVAGAPDVAWSHQSALLRRCLPSSAGEAAVTLPIHHSTSWLSVLPESPSPRTPSLRYLAPLASIALPPHGHHACCTVHGLCEGTPMHGQPTRLFGMSALEPSEVGLHCQLAASCGSPARPWPCSPSPAWPLEIRSFGHWTVFLFQNKFKAAESSKFVQIWIQVRKFWNKFSWVDLNLFLGLKIWNKFISLQKCLFNI